MQDIVDANVLAAHDATLEDAINVGTGTETTILELTESIQAVAETDAAIEHVEPRVGDIEHSQARIAKAADDFEYHPTVGLANGLETIL